jgi:hypothetical protein
MTSLFKSPLIKPDSLFKSASVASHVHKRSKLGIYDGMMNKKTALNKLKQKNESLEKAISDKYQQINMLKKRKLSHPKSEKIATEDSSIQQLSNEISELRTKSILHEYDRKRLERKIISAKSKVVPVQNIYNYASGAIPLTRPTISPRSSLVGGSDIDDSMISNYSSEPETSLPFSARGSNIQNEEEVGTTLNEPEQPRAPLNVAPYPEPRQIPERPRPPLETRPFVRTDLEPVSEPERFKGYRRRPKPEPLNPPVAEPLPEPVVESKPKTFKETLGITGNPLSDMTKHILGKLTGKTPEQISAQIEEMKKEPKKSTIKAKVNEGPLRPTNKPHSESKGPEQLPEPELEPEPQPRQPLSVKKSEASKPVGTKQREILDRLTGKTGLEPSTIKAKVNEGALRPTPALPKPLKPVGKLFEKLRPEEVVAESVGNKKPFVLEPKAQASSSKPKGSSTTLPLEEMRTKILSSTDKELPSDIKQTLLDLIGKVPAPVDTKEEVLTRQNLQSKEPYSQEEEDKRINKETLKREQDPELAEFYTRPQFTISVDQHHKNLQEMSVKPEGYLTKHGYKKKNGSEKGYADFLNKLLDESPEYQNLLKSRSATPEEKEYSNYLNKLKENLK